ncbi:cephalosporin hydroxylase family protein [Planktothrix agardhii 1806]|jgi:cephalosporin hydroxylase|uniref:cephalosporin hydroxylase family protein n=1 Tax=Planktothrix agardhii TaxID=1160 RepID=UPI001F25A486|nr:cephalosporin hydroxylase family protein [Planktothrix agardhii]MCF3569904.1 cephalosporin hydroxylase family protein [Planktothrix agardhii 1805]MCF3586984.1 cephalosporin hydroxylase family protein [Planktothrix agardhii 1803]MCF3603909.1 cephalosporin hydroxylase family protein [Planktothrix agardhii 1804]MCF3615180.1 cephalosporin hydroxylase family protein [Planktothrix agardhii 1806]
MFNLEGAIDSAVKFFQQGDYFKTELVCQQILEDSPNCEIAIKLLGKIHYARLKPKSVSNYAGEAYHLWYYNSHIWTTTTWAGVNVLKSPCDLWNYQEIIYELKPSLIIEFGTRYGGATLFFADLLDKMPQTSKVLSVDIDQNYIDHRVQQHPRIELMISSSTHPVVAQRILKLRQEFPGRIFAILDSDHAKNHVLGEMLLLRPLLQPGDYLIVEDGNINGHPVLPGWGEGPYEAIEEYFSKYPHDYQLDEQREQKFGFTWAPKGFLIRC